ncbi:SRPBCC domain-containing protein [Dyadobacter sp. 676]|uniref:SRPBCC domain-containing protein n=1 Tax=Dyadobacter sp. 676 TaxID=3088362 RepID=A0AAU8FJX8_9BACT
MQELIRLEIPINAPAANIWTALTDPTSIGKWMLDSPVEILTEWRLGGRISERGDLHGLPFENRGEIVRFEPGTALAYTHWSTLSEIADVPENYSFLLFEIQNTDKPPKLMLTIDNLPTFAVRKHLEFYWKMALYLLKEVAEN